MSVTVQFNEQFEMPFVASLAEFRRWALADEAERGARVDYLAGRIEVATSPEDLYTHTRPKMRLGAALDSIAVEEGLGDVFGESARVSCPAAGISVEPDLVFVSRASLASGRVRLVPAASGEPRRFVELEGPPDLIVEIVSEGSVRKDTVRLLDAYFRAGVDEYWLVDARGEEMRFAIHAPAPGGFAAAPRDAQGFQWSEVLRRWFRFTRELRDDGLGAYRVEHKPELAS